LFDHELDTSSGHRYLFGRCVLRRLCWLGQHRVPAADHASHHDAAPTDYNHVPATDHDHDHDAAATDDDDDDHDHDHDDAAACDYDAAATDDHDAAVDVSRPAAADDNNNSATDSGRDHNDRAAADRCYDDDHNDHNDRAADERYAFDVPRDHHHDVVEPCRHVAEPCRHVADNDDRFGALGAQRFSSVDQLFRHSQSNRANERQRHD
jgi:hypothetical protein